MFLQEFIIHILKTLIFFRDKNTFLLKTSLMECEIYQYIQKNNTDNHT